MNCLFYAASEFGHTSDSFWFYKTYLCYCILIHLLVWNVIAWRQNWMIYTWFFKVVKVSILLSQSHQHASDIIHYCLYLFRSETLVGDLHSAYRCKPEMFFKQFKRSVLQKREKLDENSKWIYKQITQIRCRCF